MVAAADASEESKTPNHKEGEPVSEEPIADHPSVPRTPKQLSVLEYAVMIAADSSESKAPNRKEK